MDKHKPCAIAFKVTRSQTAGIFWDARDADTAADKINRISKCTSSPSIHTVISTDKDCLMPHLVNPEHTTETFTNKGRQNMQSNTFHTSMNMMTQSHHMPQLSVFKGISLYTGVRVYVLRNQV